MTPQTLQHNFITEDALLIRRNGCIRDFLGSGVAPYSRFRPLIRGKPP
jgi:hypothetical protein